MLIALANYNSSSKRMLLGLVEASLILLLLCFIVKRLLGFYFYFEAVLIPIFLMVLGWGYQPERLRAAFYIFFYTLTASLPLLVRIV
jgi:NADH-ubiquinone oxidoreductase chain 4